VAILEVLETSHGQQNRSGDSVVGAVLLSVDFLVFMTCRNFDRAILAGYRWLSNHYRPGDRIFLFGTTPLTLVQLELNQASGFSRGAYQVRALAAMIDKVCIGPYKRAFNSIAAGGVDFTRE
jgi:hypothetical protein